MKYWQKQMPPARRVDRPHRSIAILPGAPVTKYYFPTLVRRCTMTFTRRRFARGSAALAAAAIVPTSPPAGQGVVQGTLKVRRSVGDLIREAEPADRVLSPRRRRL